MGFRQQYEKRNAEILHFVFNLILFMSVFVGKKWKNGFITTNRTW